MSFSFVDRAFKSLDNIFFNINEIFGQSANCYNKLETSNSEHAICANDGSLVSIIELVGNKEIMGSDEFFEMVDNLTIGLTPYLNATGHALQVVMTYDPRKSKDIIDPVIDRIVSTSKNIGLSIEPLMIEWGDNIAGWCSFEKVFLVAWTNPGVLPKSERKKAGKKMAKSAIKSSPGGASQVVGRVMPEIKNSHTSYVHAIVSAFNKSGMVTKTFDVHTALWWIRKEIDPEFTSRSWRALLPGDPLPQRAPDVGSPYYDKSCCWYPRISDQLFVREPEEYDRQTIKIGDRLHSPMVMSLPPQRPTPFNSIFKELIQKKIPFRTSFFIDGGGTSVLWWKAILSSVLHITSSANKKFNQALEELKNRELENECVVRFQACFDTWVNAHKEDAFEILSSRSAEMASAIQGWGTCDVQEVIGDPMLGVCATIPGLMPSSPAPPAVAPLEEVFSMFPLSRPASLWEDGSFLLRSYDGKPMPYLPGSSLQAAWIDIGVAPMGGGKSVFLNSYNLAYLLQSGVSRLPFLSIVDVGPSSRGLILLLQNALPEGKKYLAAYHRLQMNESYSINPFDTPLGCRKPIPSHKSFLVNLISIFCTPLDKEAPQSGIEGMARQVIDMAYDNFSDEKNPKIFNPILDPKINELVKDLGIEIDAKTSWWEIVDALFKEGYHYEAARAQRYAVPLLADVASFVKKSSVSQIYDYQDHGSGEDITKFFWRSCMEAFSAYPILKNPTQFDVGEAKVVSLDLNEVAPKGGPEATRQSGVMYMLARYVVGGKFFLMPEDVQYMPEKYRGYHAERIKEIRRDPKRLCYDEMHRAVSKNSSNSLTEQIKKDLETAARESRKWNLSIGLYTQNIKDFPDILINLSTSTFILGSGGQGDRNILKETLGLNNTALTAIKNLGKPDRSGAKFVAVFQTDKGEITQLLTNSIGMQALWAFSSTTEDTAVRDALYETLGFHKTLEVLAEKYPGGIKSEVERRRNRIKYSEFEDKVDVIDSLIGEIEESCGVK